MSLILEALRKLERDKDAPERGFVVLAHVPWARTQARSRLVGLGALALALALAVAGVAAVLWRGHRAPAEGASARATAPPAPSPPSPTPAAPPTLAALPSLPPSRVTSPPAVAAGGPAPAPSPAAPAAATPRPEAAPAMHPPPTPPPRAAAQPELRLNAISRRDDLPVAVLNDRLVREGDVFDGIRVIRIGETEVEVEVRGKRRVLTF